MERHGLRLNPNHLVSLFPCFLGSVGPVGIVGVVGVASRGPERGDVDPKDVWRVGADRLIAPGWRAHGVSTRGVRGRLARYDPRHCLSPAGSCEQRPGLEAEADVATGCGPLILILSAS